MPDFRTLYEQKKWNDITATEKMALRHMGEGTATEQDVHAVQHLISQYQALVSSTFKSGLRALKVTAEQRIQKVADHREALGKPELTPDQFSRLLDLAIDKAWKSEGAELAVLLESELEKSKDTQNAEIESLLDRKLGQFNAPAPPVDIPAPVSNPIERMMNNEPEPPPIPVAPPQQAPTLLTRSFSHEEDEEETDAVPITEQLINEANKSSNLTDDLQKELNDLKNPDKRDDREGSKIKKWWRAFKRLKPMTKAAVGLGAGLALMMGKLLATQFMGGNIWGSIKENFTWANIKSVASDLVDYGKDFLRWGWKQLSDFMSFEKIKQLVKDALVGGLDMLGSFGASIKRLLGLDDAKAPDSPKTPSIRIPGPGNASTIPSGMSPQEVVQKAANEQGTANPVTPYSGPVTGADGLPVPESVVPIPGPSAIPMNPGGSGLVDYTPLQTGIKFPEPDKTVVAYPQVKGAGTQTNIGNVTPANAPVNLGTAADNEIPRAPGPSSSGSTMKGTGSAMGGVRSTMQGFSLGQSVDGTLTMMNMGMLTQ